MRLNVFKIVPDQAIVKIFLPFLNIFETACLR
jgi:hypothetical protein